MRVNGYEIKPGANLYCADLRGADLYCADLYGADLRSANLYGANLYGADLRSVNLSGADLRSVNLSGANLHSANLTGANLYGADLYGADLYGANLHSANLPRFQITPKGYSMIGFKKLSGGTVAVLEIPSEAGRTASLIGRKCRAEYVKVISGEGYDGHTGKTYYKEGEIVYPDKYDPDIRVECTNGIHFFQTYEEAEEY